MHSVFFGGVLSGESSLEHVVRVSTTFLVPNPFLCVCFVLKDFLIHNCETVIHKFAARSASCLFQALSVRRGGTKERAGLRKRDRNRTSSTVPSLPQFSLDFFSRPSQFRSSRPTESQGEAIVPGKYSHMKGAGMLVGNFKLNPQRRSIREWLRLFLLTPKR